MDTDEFFFVFPAVVLLVAYNAAMTWRVYIREHPQFGTWYRRVENKPGWVWKAAAICAMLVIVVPLVLLTLAAAVVGLVVFAVLGLVAMVLNAFAGIFGDGSSEQSPMARRGSGHGRNHDGRENVRIIDQS